MLCFVLFFPTSPAVALPFVRVSTVVAAVNTWGFIKIKIKMVIRSLMHLFHPLHHQSNRTWCSHRYSKRIECSRIWSSRFLQRLCNQVSESEITEAATHKLRNVKLGKLPISRDVGQGWQGVGLAGATSVVIWFEICLLLSQSWVLQDKNLRGDVSHCRNRSFDNRSHHSTRCCP